MKFYVSIRRINKYLNCDELDGESMVSTKIENTSQILLKNAFFRWDKDDNIPTLSKITLEIKPKFLIGIVGRTGSGKSSLLSALLGEMFLSEGFKKIRGSIAYVPQHAWIQNATIRSNILFGKEYHDKKYQKVIKSCALESDFTILPG
jgi:ABC-type multidrug transport system fused ATPase/permease subunit